MADDPIEDLFRQRLQHHQEAPPANGWQRIHQSLQEPKRKPFALWRWLSLALLPVATGVLVVKNLPENTLATTSETATETTAPGHTQPMAAPHGNTAAKNAGQHAAAGSAHGAASAAPGNNQTNQPQSKHVAALSSAEKQTQNSPESRQTTGNNTQLTAANPPETAVALASDRKQKPGAAGVVAAGPATQRRPLKTAQAQLALAQPQPQTTANATGTEAKERDENDEAAAPNQTKTTAANQPGNGNALPKNPSGGAPAGSGASAGAATNATVPKAPTTSQPNPPTLASDSLTETQAKDAQRLMAGGILTDSALAATHVEPKATVTATREADKKEKGKDDKTDNRTWHFGAFAGADYGLRRFAPNTTDQVHIQQLTDKDQFYPERLNYEAGALAQRQLSDKFALEAGLGLKYFREQVAFKAASGAPASFSLTQANNLVSVQPVYQYQTVQSTTTAWYSSLRVGAVYSVAGSGQTRLQLTGGAQANYLLTQKTTGNAAEHNVTEPQATKLQAGAYAGLRVLHRLPGGASVALEPGFRYFAEPGQKQNQAYSLRSHAATLNLIFFLK